ncbi:MAG: inorganic phosphate transporter, partial [Anaerolineales bacterium]|nr:inorganic phosphate transporter [Anaerolineales bacterium]
NIVSTIVSSRTISSRKALLLAAIAEFTGLFVFGVAVATTIGSEFIETSAITLHMILAGMLAAITWNLVTFFFAIPSSSSHSLLGGLLGAALISHGVGVVKLEGLLKIILALFLSPIAGLLVGFLLMKFTLWSVRKASPKINTGFKQMQFLTFIGMGLSHGSNDGQKIMGVITMGLLSAGVISSFIIPTWVIAASAGAMALGTILSGTRLLRTLGGRIYRIRPIHGFTAQFAAASVILGATLLGGPVSTTQVMSSAIIGAGAGDRINKVHWNILLEMLLAWFLTIPTTAGISALFYLLVDTVL